MRPGCDNPLVQPTRAGRRRRFCSNVCAVARDKAKRGGSATLPSHHATRGYVATALSPFHDVTGRPKTIYRYGATPDEADERLFEAVVQAYDTVYQMCSDGSDDVGCPSAASWRFRTARGWVPFCRTHAQWYLDKGPDIYPAEAIPEAIGHAVGHSDPSPPVP